MQPGRSASFSLPGGSSRPTPPQKPASQDVQQIVKPPRRKQSEAQTLSIGTKGASMPGSLWYSGAARTQFKT